MHAKSDAADSSLTKQRIHHSGRCLNNRLREHRNNVCSSFKGHLHIHCPRTANVIPCFKIPRISLKKSSMKVKHAQIVALISLSHKVAFLDFEWLAAGGTILKVHCWVFPPWIVTQRHNRTYACEKLSVCSTVYWVSFLPAAFFVRCLMINGCTLPLNMATTRKTGSATPQKQALVPMLPWSNIECVQNCGEGWPHPTQKC